MIEHGTMALRYDELVGNLEDTCGTAAKLIVNARNLGPPWST